MSGETEHTVFTFIECTREEECGWHDMLENEDPTATLRACPRCGAETRIRTLSLHEMRMELRQGLYNLRDTFKMIADRVPSIASRERFETTKAEMILTLPDYLAVGLIDIEWDDDERDRLDR